MRNLVENIEQYTFWSTDNKQLHKLKKEVSSQINNLPIYITAREFFTIDRRLLTAVRYFLCKNYI